MKCGNVTDTKCNIVDPDIQKETVTMKIECIVSHICVFT